MVLDVNESPDDSSLLYCDEADFAYAGPTVKSVYIVARWDASLIRALTVVSTLIISTLIIP